MSSFRAILALGGRRVKGQTRSPFRPARDSGCNPRDSADGGPRVDLAINPIELCAERVLLRRGARDEGSGAECRALPDPRTAPAHDDSETPHVTRHRHAAIFL
jgi:hypothetical protein